MTSYSHLIDYIHYYSIVNKGVALTEGGAHPPAMQKEAQRNQLHNWTANKSRQKKHYEETHIPQRITQTNHHPPPSNPEE
jgi:hypothetical protein